MKLKLLTILFAAASLTAFTSCSDDDDDDVKVPASGVPTEVVQSFKAKYPSIDVSKVKWETKGNYTVAEFSEAANQEELEAWFTTKTGEWAMTETDFGEDLFLVPAELNAKYYQTEYSSWNIDDMKLYSYPDSTKDRYVFEVNKTGQQDMELYFTADTYDLVKAIVDTDRVITPDTAL
ncbi:MAG: hypothetical protein HDS53_02360 [Barnesiella sp.]|nr:hypothetical protein [Barnesiella sp.]